MEEKNLPFQFEDKGLAQNLLQSVGELLKDSDATEEKEMVKNFLQKISEAMTFVAVGDAGVGKTTFLNRLFVVFDALKIRSLHVWDFLAETSPEKMVFVMTRCDLADEQTIKDNRIKVQQYMSEEGIDAPIFSIGSGSDADVEALRRYIWEQVLGETPTLTKQQQNMQHLEGMLTALGSSFSLRKKQYESDKVILENINTEVDGFLSHNESVVNRLKGELRNIIATQIDAYQAEIISKMDPLKIRERCPGGPSEVEAYLGAVNENYRNIMNEQISATTQDAVRKYCADLQDVFEEATGFFRKRQNLLDAEDQFYGSLAKSKKEMLYESDTMMADLSRFYEKLAGASEKLFMDVWKARGEYDAAIQKKSKKYKIREVK